MATKPMLQIVEFIEPTPTPYRRFRILETYVSIDGYRTRVCNEGYATLDQAKAYVAHKEGICDDA